MDTNGSVVQTEDGSATLVSGIFHERYHSIHGAKTESDVVFISAGLSTAAKSLNKVTILEMGFGTGLNALMSWDYAEKNKVKVEYIGYEKYPITTDNAEELAYGSLFKSSDEFLKLHTIKENTKKDLSEYFSFEKQFKDIIEIDNEDYFDVIYFDAFAPAAQEELWTIEIFQKMYNSLKSGGILVTYCAKGQVKRNMKAAGFHIEGLPGPPGKREMTRAQKL